MGVKVTVVPGAADGVIGMGVKVTVVPGAADGVIGMGVKVTVVPGAVVVGTVVDAEVVGATVVGAVTVTGPEVVGATVVAVGGNKWQSVKVVYLLSHLTNSSYCGGVLRCDVHGWVALRSHDAVALHCGDHP